MIEDAAPRVLLTQAATLDLLPESVRAQCVDARPEAWKAEPTTRLACEVLPKHLAYVIFTSGSTGRPKGTLNTHEGIRNRLLWMQEAFRIDASDAVLQK